MVKCLAVNRGEIERERTRQLQVVSGQHVKKITRLRHKTVSQIHIECCVLQFPTAECIELVILDIRSVWISAGIGAQTIGHTSVNQDSGQIYLKFNFVRE